MHKLFNHCRKLATLALAAGFLPWSAPGQMPVGRQIAKVDKISARKLNSPEYEAKRVTTESAKRQQWGQITCYYETDPEWLDELEVQYFVLVKAKQAAQGENPFKVLRGVVTYVNIAKGRHTSEMYLHPSTLARYGDIERVAVLMYSQGQLAAIASEPKTEERWWERLAPTDGFLMNHSQSPYSLINVDAYDAIKAEGTRR